MDRATVPVFEEELEPFYAAALAFIDPELKPHSSLADIEAAASRRQIALASLPAQFAVADLQRIEEALHFVRRVQLRQGDGFATATGFAEPDGDSDGILKSAPNSEYARNGLELSDFRGQAAASKGNGANGYAIEPAEVPTTPARGHKAPRPSAEDGQTPTQASVIATSRSTVRRSPLSRLWDELAEESESSTLLPEQQVLPVARGLALLLWEGWLALFAGWAVTRFLGWPVQGVSYSLPGALGLTVAGSAAALVVLWLIWRYRVTSHKLALLAHASAALVALDLLAWKLRAGDALPVISSPGAIAWVLLAAGWVAAAGLAHLSDLRQR